MKTPGPSFDLASLHTLVDSLPALIFANRSDRYLDFCNQRMLDFVGLPFEDLEGWKWGGVVHPDDVAPLTERWQASLASGEPFECEARVRRADGEYRWMLHREVAVRDGFGRVVRWYGSSVDSFVSTKPQGTGFARSIVESHGGRLWATGNSGPGATFLFTLPGDAGERLG